MFITYGARANSFLLVEYGFCIANNVYDFVRVKGIDVATFYPKTKDNKAFISKVEAALSQNFNMKGSLQADLKESFLHRDVMRLIRQTIRVNEPGIAPQECEVRVLKKYEEWVK